MNYYNTVFNYSSIFILLFTLFFTGFLIFKRVTIDRRIQLLLPAGSIFGICLYIFLLNLSAHFIKGVPGFLFALSLQIILTLLIARFIPTSPLTFPKGKEAKIWILILFIWVIFSYQITAHATTDGADSTLHQSFATRFIRGDYPMHTPWQPDYIAYYHFGGAQLLGSFHALTGAPYFFLHPFIAFWMLLFISQILTWVILLPEKMSLRLIFIRFLPAFVGLISLGGFFIIWPVKFELPSSLREFPTFYNALEVYGAPFNLDALVFFLHRFLATSFFISLFVLLLYPKKGLLAFFVLAVYLAAMALTDESVLIVTIIPILIVSFLNMFNRSIKIFALSIGFIFLVILFQGGLITETVLNRYGDHSNILIFPKDSNLPHEKYRSYRLDQQKSRFYITTEKKTLNWLHPGIVWQLILCSILFFVLLKKSKDNSLKVLSGILLLSGIISLIAFHGLVPKGYTHPNGNRFLALSYYLSGLCLAYLLYFWFSQKINIPKIIKYLLNILILWILLTSLVSPLLQLFPRKVDNWFIIKPHVINPVTSWVRNNIPLNKNIVALTGIEFSNSMNIELVKEAGAATPMWPPKPRVHDSFDISPTYADLHYTLNPQAIKLLRIDYILINSSYFQQLPEERKQDVSNKDFFTPIFISSDKSTIILQVNPKFLLEGKNFEGTFAQLDQIAPQDGTYCVDYPPNISENVYRILRLLLHNRNYYCDKGGAFYNARIDVQLHTFAGKLDQYDYLVLGKDVTPKTICNCSAKLLWEGFGNGVKFWQTQ